MDRYFTKEEIARLEEIDAVRHFTSVLDSEYKRGTTFQLDNEVADIYDTATGQKVSRNFTCKNCVYNLYRSAGIKYRQSVQHWNEEKMKKVREAKKNKENKGE